MEMFFNISVTQKNLWFTQQKTIKLLIKKLFLLMNFERIYRNKPEGYTYKRERTWQFNNLKPREYK